MPEIEFIYDRGCPNVDDARRQLGAALEALHRPKVWQEWERSDPASPAYSRRYGSPTILVDGDDIAGQPPAEAPSCRIYSDSRGRTRGVPDRFLIMQALQRHMETKP